MDNSLKNIFAVSDLRNRVLFTLGLLGVYRLGLMSFPVFFQCKRYRGSVGAGAVRDYLVQQGIATEYCRVRALPGGATLPIIVDGITVGVVTRLRLSVDCSISHLVGSACTMSV